LFRKNDYCCQQAGGSGGNGGSSERDASSTDGAATNGDGALRLSDVQNNETGGGGYMGGDSSWASGAAEGTARQGWPARTRDSRSLGGFPEVESDTIELAAAVAEAAADMRGPTGKPAPDASERWRAAHVDEFAERRRQKRRAAANGLEDGG